MPAGQVFSFSGKGENLYFLEKGYIRMFLLSRKGSMKTFCIHSPGSIFGEVNLVDESPNPWLGEPLSHSVVKYIPAAEARAALLAHPELALSLVGSLSKKLRMAGKQIADLSFRPIAARVACVILARTGEHLDPTRGSGEATKPVGLTHEEIARFVGSNRETVTRVLRSLKTEGVIDYDRNLARVTIRNQERLEEIASEEF
jgi:CRP/FNR family transcriptional regulator